MTRKDAFYNSISDSVDMILDDNTTLRLNCQTIFPTIKTTFDTYYLMVTMSRKDPALFVELVLDGRLTEYLNSMDAPE